MSDNLEQIFLINKNTMDYCLLYNNIVTKAKTRKVFTGYGEKHHIIPKCLGGSNDKSNLVKLTPKEHLLCHKLLVLIYPENPKLKYALWAMVNQNKNNKRCIVSLREYEKIRQLYFTGIKEFWSSKENKKKRSETVKKTWENPRRKEKHLKIHKGAKRSLAGRMNMRKKHKPHRFRSTEHKSKISEKTKNRIRLTCSFCSREIQFCFLEKHIKSCKYKH